MFSIGISFKLFQHKIKYIKFCVLFAILLQ